MLSSGSGDQLCSLPAVVLWSWVFAVLVCWGLISLPCPFLWGKVSYPSAGPLLSVCCDVLLIFFNFAVSFDFGCCSLDQEMSFVDHYQLYFRKWLITCLLSAVLPSQPLLTESSCRDQLTPCSSPFLWSAFSFLPPSTVC
jgi:hypothetical protein